MHGTPTHVHVPHVHVPPPVPHGHHDHHNYHTIYTEDGVRAEPLYIHQDRVIAVRRQRVPWRDHIIAFLFLTFFLVFGYRTMNFFSPGFSGGGVWRDSPTTIKTFYFDNPKDLHIEEKLNVRAQVQGQFRLAQASQEQKHNFVITVESTDNRDGEILSVVDYETTDDTLTISSEPDSLPNGGFPRDYLRLTITVSVKSDAAVDTFTINAKHLSVYIDKSLDLVVYKGTHIHLINGCVGTSPAEQRNFVSRVIRVETQNGAITGEYSLYDILDLRSDNGHVEVAVVPKTESSKDPKDPEFTVYTKNGQIQVETAKHDVPKRNYSQSITSNNGRIHGTFIHTTKTYMESDNGGIDVKIVPCDSASKRSELTTLSSSGQIQVEIVSPLSGDKTSIMSTLDSRHESHNSQIQLQYPTEWAGSYEGSTSNGRITVRHDGQKVIETSGHVNGDKGNGDSKLVFRSSNGQIQVNLG